MRHRSPVVLIVLAAALVLPAAAAAQTYCVNEPACVTAGGKDEGATAEAVQKALDSAEVNTGSTVIIGGGRYQRPVKEGFSYNSSHPVTIEGAGEGATILTTVVKPGGPVLNLFSSPATVSGMTIEIPAETDLLGINANAATLEHVAVLATGGENDEGVKMDGGIFRDGSIDMSKNTGQFAVGVLMGGGEVVGSTIVSFEGIAPSSSGTEAVRGSRISAVDGIALEGNATVEDTLVDARHVEGARAVNIEARKLNATATLRALTIVNGGKESVGLDLSGAEAKQTATVADTVIAGIAIPIETEQGGPGAGQSTSTSYSSYEATSDAHQGGAPLPSDVNPVAGGPGFVKPLFAEGGFSEAVWSLTISSPLIDAGTPGSLAPGESTTDLAGNPRVVNARRDVGAYEFQRTAPVVSATASPSTVALGAPVSFSGSASSPEAAAGDAIAGYQWKFDDGAIVPAGATATHAFTKYGVHTATLTASDLIGVLGTATVQVTVPPPSGPCGCAVLPPVRELGHLAMHPSSFRAARSGPSITAKKRGSLVSFVQSGRARATFTVEHVSRGIIRGRSCRAPRRGLHGKACTRKVPMRGSVVVAGLAGPNSYHFTGRLGGRTLAPGRYVLLAAVVGGPAVSASAAFRIIR